MHIISVIDRNLNDLENEMEILYIYKSYYNKNDKLKNHMINDFKFHQVEIVKRILHISKNVEQIKIAFKFAQQLV